MFENVNEILLWFKNWDSKKWFASFFSEIFCLFKNYICYFLCLSLSQFLVHFYVCREILSHFLSSIFFLSLFLLIRTVFITSFRAVLKISLSLFPFLSLSLSRALYPLPPPLSLFLFTLSTSLFQLRYFLFSVYLAHLRCF